ncbi:MAG: glutathione S-transferase family protein [Myxococcales bacterium]|nr:glutathione S-transferase family protein [Myxococcales bacterium]MCB9735366.1 glutathione S-transferase family protein [Deltaproteobacteria bacterium]
MILYTHPASPNCRKVDAVVKHLGLEVEVQIVDILRGATRTPEFKLINPNAKVPVLVDGDVTLWESNAIAAYLASKTESGLWPRTNARYDIMRWQSWELAHFYPPARDITAERIIKPLRGLPTDETVCAKAEVDFRHYAGILDAHLAEHRWLVGDGLTVADFCVAACLTYAVPARLPLEDAPHVRAWLGALDELPAWRASSPPPM